jgi:Rhs element Vgr protein
MSISIKNITISIDGTLSKKFKIDIDGARYNLDDFKLTQQLLKPNTLTFTMHKNPEEDISEPQFTACSSIIGKPITLDIQTDSTEREISDFAESGQSADIEFKGIITSASASRTQSEYLIHVEAHSWDILLIDNPNCKSYEDMSLKDIISDVFEDVSTLSNKIDPRYTDIIPYTVQYNENNYEFLSRLARRYGEWLYNDGTRLVFGKIQDEESIQLSYPSKDVPSYSVRMQIQHVPFKHVISSYNANASSVKEGKEEMQKSMNALNDSVYNASNNNYTKETWQNLHSGGYANSDSRETVLSIASKTQARGERANMLLYEGKTYCSNLKLGGKLIIKDNYIAESDKNGKSEVNQDEILIIGLEHFFSADEQYHNLFQGIPSACDYPPYINQEVYPHCPPCRATVKENEDPNHLGRIRVQFAWQKEQDESMMTPWIRIIQPYSGGGKGFSFIPETEEEVLVDFEGGNAERPYISGMLFNGKDAPDNQWLIQHNEVKAIRTRNGHTIEFHDHDDQGHITIYDNREYNYKLTLSATDRSIKLEAKANIEFHAGNDIILVANNDFNITVKKDFKIDVANDINLKSTTLKLNVSNEIDIETYTFKLSASIMKYEAMNLSIEVQQFEVNANSYTINVGTQFSLTANIISFTAASTASFSSGAAMSFTSSAALNLQATLINMN